MGFTVTCCNNLRLLSNHNHYCCFLRLVFVPIKIEIMPINWLIFSWVKKIKRFLSIFYPTNW
uniref:Orf61 n=1 Tax=Moineauvirus Sfi21 TaxID=64186 RepID=O21866_9CAUD|nr:orf61 [Streptococcus phage Sfi21]